MTKRKRVLLISLPVLLLLLAGTAALFFFGVLHLNHPSKERYPVRGVDVSSWQGEIDWPTLAGEGISFAWIKATEGSTFTDPKFAFNAENALKTGLAVGAYHFFSFETPGKTQAEHFLATVSGYELTLPPVVDLEFYGSFSKTPPDREAVLNELSDFISAVREKTGKEPVLYLTGASYRYFIEGEDAFSASPIWFRNVYTGIGETDARIRFWQFSNRHVLKGYGGKERYVDMNCFLGSEEEFRAFLAGER